MTQWGARVLRTVMIIPFQRFELIKRMNFFLNIVAINSWLLFRPQPKILWFFEPRYLSLFLRFSIFKLSVFDCVDYFSAYENWHAEQVYCLKKALIVAFNSHTLKRHYQTVRPDTLVVPLGLSVQDMSPILPKKEKRSFLTIGFIGSIGYRIDFKFLNRLFIARPKDKFVFIGPQDFDLKTSQGRKSQKLFQQLIDQKIIHWLPKLSRKKAWLKAREFDVGLIPYDTRDPFMLVYRSFRLISKNFHSIKTLCTSLFNRVGKD